MTECSIDKSYNISDYGSTLLRIVGSTFKRNKDKSVPEIYDAIIDKLTISEDIPFGQKDESESYARFMLEVKSELTALINKVSKKFHKDDSEFRSLIDDNFLASAGVVYDTSTLTEEVESAIIPNESLNDEEEVSVKLFNSINDYYGTAIKANSYRKQLFGRDIIESAIINLEEETVVKTTIDLNRNIALLKNKYFYNIVKYLQNIDPNFSGTTAIYSSDGKVLPNYQLIFNKFYNELKKLQESNELESKILEGWKRRLLGEEDLFYDAFNSYINLNYFDTLLEEAVGKVIKVSNSALADDEWNLSYNKYIFSKGDDHKRKDWRNEENRDALKDIARFSKLIISTIPIYSSINGKFLNRYVNIGNFSDAITSLFVNAYKLKNETLKDAIISFHDNPYYYSQIIFDLISNEDIHPELMRIGIDLFKLNVLTSVFKHIYDTSNPKSIKSIELSTDSRYSINGYPIMDAINGVIDRLMDATYLQVVYSADNNTLETSEKSKFTNRKESYNIINSVNNLNFYSGRTPELRFLLAKRYKVNRVSGTIKYSVKVGNVLITGRNNSKQGILGTKRIILTFSDKRIEEIFNRENKSIDLISTESVNKIIAGLNLSEEEQLFRDILEFIDSFLNTRILTPSGMDLLANFKEYTDSENYIKPLLESALRAAVINDINYQFDNALETDPEYNSILDYSNFIKSIYPPFKSLNFNSSDAKSIVNVLLGVPDILTVKNNENWIDLWAITKKIISGEVSKSTIKDINNNAISNNRTSFLGGNIKYYLKKYKESGDTAATSPLLFTNNDLIVKTLLNADSLSRKGIKKRVREMSTSELFYTSIINNFYGNYLLDEMLDKFKNQNRNNLYKCILTQPTTYSDKVSFVTHAINANKPLQAPGKSYDGKTLYQLNTEEVIDLYIDTIGQAYINLYNNVLNDLKVVLDMPSASFDEINEKLHTLTPKELTDIADRKGIELLLDTHYRSFGNYCKFNELLYHYVNDLYINRNKVVLRFKKEQLNFVNDLIESGVCFYTTYADDSNYTLQRKSSSSIISKIIRAVYPQTDEYNKYVSNWVKHNKLIIAKTSDGREITGGGINIPEDADIILNPLFEKYFYLDSLVSNNLRFELTGSEINHPDKSKINFKQEGINPLIAPECFILLGSKALNTTNDKLFNLSTLQNSNDIEYEIVREPWKTDNTKTKKVLKIYIKGNRDLGSFELVADTDNNRYNGEYSVYFKTGNADTGVSYGSTKELREILYKYLISAIPMGAKVSTWGEVSLGGEIGLNKVGKDMYIVGIRNVKDGNSKTINVYLKTDIIDNVKDLVWLKKQSDINPALRPAYESIIYKIEAVALGTQLKRNVIIPATLQYELQGTFNGIAPKMKVAVIKDTQSEVFNFRGDDKEIDAHDGSAFISPLISILENKALLDLEVGVDKKPIWHHYNPKLMTSTLLKFATFTMTAERMRTSLNSDINLYNLFKKMHDLPWNNIDLLAVAHKEEFDFLDDIIGDTPLYYEENGRYYQINGFGRDENGYYTEEVEVNFLGNIRSEDDESLKVYHRFDSNSHHLKFRNTTPPPISEELHDINSLFQLYNVMGGIYAHSLIEYDDGLKKLQPSDLASYAVVNFMNNVTVLTDDPKRPYYQPLKDMLIGYAANNTAVKNGAANLNEESAWADDSKLKYMTLDTDGLGIQMDADHEIDESTMAEFTLVISALEASGRKHDEAREVYRTLGNLAIEASRFEIDAAVAYIKATELNSDMSVNQIRSELYDIFARVVINNYKLPENRTDLTAPIILTIKKEFNLQEDHNLDNFKLPCSDNSLYSQIIPTFISNINGKSIKRRYPGSGCVMVPSYNIILTFKYRGLIKLFDDALADAKKENITEPFFEEFDSLEISITDYNKQLVLAYLNKLLKEEWDKAVTDVELFIPTDKVDILANGIYIGTINLDSINDYYGFQGYSIQNPDGDKETRNIIRKGFILKKLNINVNDAQLTFAMNVTRPRNLAPARIRWKYKDLTGEHINNIFNTKAVRHAFLRKKDPSFDLKENRKLVLKIFDDLSNGIDDEGHKIYDLENEAAELVISNMYASKFNTKGLSLALILEKGPKQFKIGLPPIYSNHYDLAFTTSSGRHQYISFTEPKTDKENNFRPRDVGWEFTKPIGNDVYAITKNGLKRFKVGEYIIKNNATQIGDKWIDENGKEIKNFRLNKNGSLQVYKPFISHFRVSESVKRRGSNNHARSYDLYVVNIENIKEVHPDWSEKTINSYIASIFTDIYKSSDFNGIRLNTEILINSATRLFQVLPQMRVPEDLKNFIVKTTIKNQRILDEEISNNKRIHRLNEDHIKDLKQYHSKVQDSVYSSFLKSLTFTSSRIPAQTLQSFMQMKAVGFTLSSKNVVFISYWQTWLLGSDY